MRQIILIGAIVLCVVGLLAATAAFWATLFWFESLGLAAVFWQRTIGPLAVGGAVGAAAALLAAGNLLLAKRLARAPVTYLGQPRLFPDWLIGRLPWLMVPLIGLLVALEASPSWETILLAYNGSNFGVADPLFGQDVSFYVFLLPVFRLVRDWLFLAIGLSALLVGGWYLLQAGIDLRRQRLNDLVRRLPGAVRRHMTGLASLALVNAAFGYWLAAYEVVYAQRGVVVGAGYAEATAQLPAHRLMLVITLLAALGVLIFSLLGRRRLLIVSVVAWPIAALLGQIYPSIIQNLVVRPNELNLEAPYIDSSLRMTRAAFDLENVEVLDLSSRGSLTAADLRGGNDTINNLRLWDIEPLKATYAQTQEIRLYYTFADVDVDRYQVGGQYRQVMIAVRELDQTQLTQQARTWQNRHLVYTHGYGVVVSPVNEQQAEGLPRFFVENIPPTGVPELALTRPQIYFGERTSEYIFVRTLPTQADTEAEFDYPLGDSYATTTYQGQDGVRLDSYFKRLVLAFYFGDSNIVFSRNFTDETRALYHRDIVERVSRLAPFLTLDRDPYPTIANGRVVWLLDGYVTSALYPYSTPTTIRPFGRVNYARNAVKIAIDAYDGTVTFYVVDDAEPILRAYRAIYPQLFRPLAEAPAALRSHLRYPEDLFNLQSQVYTLFHMRQPQIFYNREDAWAIPQIRTGERPEPMAAYYVMMSLPEANDAEFMLMRPFTPQGKDNMVAWMVARSDGSAYGQRRVYLFPKDRIQFGPQQIDARINQEPEISQQLTLWNQHGSRAIRGNLLVVPIRETLLYVQPLYLQAENSRLPELKRVIVASSERVVMGADLASALERLVAATPGSPAAAPGAPAAPTSGPATGPNAEVARQAREKYRQAQEALRRGDWAGYGTALQELETLLDRLAGGP